MGLFSFKKKKNADSVAENKVDAISFQGISGQAVAAITAAISMILQSESEQGVPQAEFIVRSIKRVKNKGVYR